MWESHPDLFPDDQKLHAESMFKSVSLNLLKLSLLLLIFLIFSQDKKKNQYFLNLFADI